MAFVRSHFSPAYIVTNPFRLSYLVLLLSILALFNACIIAHVFYSQGTQSIMGYYILSFVRSIFLQSVEVQLYYSRV